MKQALPRACNALAKNQLYHITTPIFYPNAKPHLGHLYSSLLCDASKRWHGLLDQKTLLTTGTDEHGLKIQTASEKNGYKTPMQFVDTLYRDFVKLDEMAQIDYTRFIRTTDDDHAKSVQDLWKRCWDRGYIYKGEHQGWYSISDECFYPDSKVVQIKEDGSELSLSDLDIDRDAKFINTETRNEVVYHSETNYFFKLSAFQDRLTSLLEVENPQFIYPPSRRDQIINELREFKLRDLSISRPCSRIKWGIDVPQDPTQKIYVWFDALCNYITSIGGLEAVISNTPVRLKHKGYTTLQNPRDWWGSTSHLIGKDISKFHTIYWPSFLMAAGLPLPKQIIIHGHWLSGGTKMSKSVGNVVDPIDIISHYGCDPVRWYILENSHIEADGDFREERLHATREQLVSKWGNLLNRCCGNKFNISRAVETFAVNSKNSEELSHNFQDQQTKTSYLNLVTLLGALPESFNKHMLKLDTRSALKLLWEIIGEANAFVQNTTPWLKSGKEQDLVIFTAVEVVRITAIISQPIIPALSGDLLDRIDVSRNKRSLSHALLGLDAAYGAEANKKGRSVPIKRIPPRIGMSSIIP
ncbi:LANO_0E15170g1_1 [Lachancea nothofagi CBS 11611]|uniref:Methionine--tRNA ligase, mitochondrial n=1 Tax=Lachancea nothofagi CBS 11611 TaxID=1266666 RepID=A0A1G4K0T2_9SACH|nr:LANO_0E15170g1_1 [Lachancea nothofagi CBS 11611]